jgi:hypothetical protein
MAYDGTRMEHCGGPIGEWHQICGCAQFIGPWRIDTGAPVTSRVAKELHLAQPYECEIGAEPYPTFRHRDERIGPKN